MSTAANVMFAFSALLTIFTSLAFLPWHGQEYALENAQADLVFYDKCTRATLTGVQTLEARVDISETELAAINAATAAVLKINETGTNPDTLTINKQTYGYHAKTGF